MNRKAAQRVVIVLSMIVLGAAFVLFVFDRVVHRRPPLLDDIGLVYGVSFAVFLFFDTIGRQAAAIRREADAGRPVPRPRPTPAADGQRVPVAPGPGLRAGAVTAEWPGPGRGGAGAGDLGEAELGELGDAETEAPGGARLQARQLDDRDPLRLTRVHQHDAGDAAAFQGLLDGAVRELLALADRVPTYDEHGHVTERTAAQWLSDPATNAFFIELQTDSGVERAGCCVIDRESGRLHLGLIYVIPAWRRQYVGRDAMSKLAEFARLATGDAAIEVDVPSHNHRGRRFLSACGFVREAGENAANSEADSFDVGHDGRDLTSGTRGGRFLLPLRNR